jgi:hypothetical protein
VVSPVLSAVFDGSRFGWECSLYREAVTGLSPGVCRIYREAIFKLAWMSVRMYREAVREPSPGFSLGRLPH